jgi:hypothetical protein
MADFIDCTTNGFSLDTILGSMFSEITTAREPLVGFRVAVYTGHAATPLTCDNYETWQDLFKQALELDGEGNATLRVLLIQPEELDVKTLMPSCTSWEGFFDLTKQSFSKLDTPAGEICLTIIQTNNII